MKDIYCISTSKIRLTEPDCQKRFQTSIKVISDYCLLDKTDNVKDKRDRNSLISEIINFFTKDIRLISTRITCIL